LVNSTDTLFAFVSFHSNTTGAIGVLGTAIPSGVPEFTSGFIPETHRAH